MKNYLVELVGTFIFMTVIGCVVIDPGAGSMAPLAIGSVLMCLVYAGGSRSGGHYNPAVTLAVFLRGKIAAKEVLPYILAQVIAAFLAIYTIGYLKGFPTTIPQMSINMGQAFVAEVIFTFALAYVVLNVATSDKTAGNSFYGLAIGFTVLIGAYSVGSISGGSFNPSVAVVLWGLGIYSVGSIGLVILANLFGASLAALLYNYLDK